MSLNLKRSLIDPSHPELSIIDQCHALGLSRSSWYYAPAKETERNLFLMKLIDNQYLETPFYGYRRMTKTLNRMGYDVNEKRIRRLMQKMGITAIYPKPKLSKPGEVSKKYPYLLRNVAIEDVDHVWSTDITYIPLKGGFMYLVAIMDWFSRYVLTWELSNTLSEDFCIEALNHALGHRKPMIFNSDQGSQFTSKQYTDILESQGIAISWDGRGRALDNVFIERLWRSLKYEAVYLKGFENVLEAYQGISNYFNFYNTERIHQSLGYLTPYEVYHKLRVT